jgi:hypothetical protein
MARPVTPADWRAVQTAIETVEAKTPLFVTGSVKAGTTWTQLWLDRHPEIACKGEGYLFNKFAGALQKLCQDMNAMTVDQNRRKGVDMPTFPPITTPMVLHLLRQTVLACLASYGTDPGLKVVAEKTPSTALALDTVLLAFPEARILHCARDGRDVAISAWHDNRRAAPSDFAAIYPTFGTFLPEIAQIWVNHQTPILKAIPEHGDRIRVIHFEDQVVDPVRVVRGVFNWLSVDESEDVATTCVAATAFEKLSQGRAPGDDDPTSFFRKGTAGQWREDMTAEQRDTFWTIAGETMTAMGYDRDGRVTPA